MAAETNAGSLKFPEPCSAVESASSGRPARAGISTRDRLPIAAAALVTLPLLLLLDTAAAMVRGWRPIAHLDRVIVAAAMAWVVLVSLGASLPPLQARLRRHAAGLMLMIGSFAFAWTLAELAAGYTLERLLHRYAHRHSPGIKTTFEPRPDIFPGIYGRSLYTVNSIGLRGPELPPREAAYRILCIGGSTTECLYLDDHEAWPFLLMDRLNRPHQRPVWIGNAGTSAYSTVQHLDFIESWNLIPQMDCLLLMVGVNDMRLTPTLQLNPLTRPLWARSKMLEWLRYLYSARKTSGNILIEDPRGAFYAERRRARRESPKRGSLPDLSRSRRNYEERLRQIIAFCRSHSVRVVFLTQPILWDQNLSKRGRSLLWLGKLTLTDEYLTVEAARAVLDQYNKTLKTACADAGVQCIDLSSMNGHEEFFYDDCHFSESGAREVARLVAGKWARNSVINASSADLPELMKN